MANTFFNLEAALINGENSAQDEDDCLENEEEYDALNDETFGALEDSSSFDDWEQQHEQYAEIAESSRHSEQLENSISKLVLDNSENRVPRLSDSVWSYTPTTKDATANKNYDNFNKSIISSLQKASKSFIESLNDYTKRPTETVPVPNHGPPGGTTLKGICTVEELEKSLIDSSKNASSSKVPLPPKQHQLRHQTLPRPLLSIPGGPGSHQHQHHPMLQHHIQNARLPPPGLPPLTVPPPGMRPPMNAHHMPGMLPPGMLRLVSPHQHFMQNGPMRPPGFMYPPPGSNPMGHHYSYHQPARMGNIPMNSQQQQQSGNSTISNCHQQYRNNMERTRNDSGHYRERNHKDYEQRDEYAGLMTMREKQWLLNIQLLQLNTGTPYFDDYYYTIFKERKSKSDKENNVIGEKNVPNSKRQQRNNEHHQENQNTLTPRVYTPLQFENSLGKLQCGSVTAPRKIIDMDIVTPDKDNESTPSISRDSRKTRQLLLELESLYSLLLKAEDINNPLYANNMDKLREMKQKQRLRELELVPTLEQRREILRLFKIESELIIENPLDYITKIIQGFLRDDKITSFLNIRKGKMLLLRLLPHLTIETFATQLLELWTKVLLSLPVVGRRDTAGDNILPKLYPYLKRYTHSTNMSDIIEIVSGLIEVVKPDNPRSTPLSHAGKSPLYFVLLNKFGVSALVILLIRVECLISSDSVTEKQENVWSNFLVNLCQQIESTMNKIPSPIDVIPGPIFNKHCDRFNNVLKAEKRSLLQKYFVDCNSNI
ncbi:unnamed protein product [Phyllotreta striolata]|uniref:mRNA decay factor PAT1 domain-containing protein n=1 Tax=Phyllotreta striolata TaxID=444603 RepID=A0A9N9TSU8_PHYSR|nr:unnamed protein product [Phyllotreta striolata]